MASSSFQANSGFLQVLKLSSQSSTLTWHPSFNHLVEFSGQDLKISGTAPTWHQIPFQGTLRSFVTSSRVRFISSAIQVLIGQYFKNQEEQRAGHCSRCLCNQHLFNKNNSNKSFHVSAKAELYAMTQATVESLAMKPVVQVLNSKLSSQTAWWSRWVRLLATLWLQC